MMNQMPMNLFWLKCENNAWCSLRDVDLSHSYYDNFVGIYIIWYWDNLGNPVTVKVGQVLIEILGNDLQHITQILEFNNMPI